MRNMREDYCFFLKGVYIYNRKMNESTRKKNFLLLLYFEDIPRGAYETNECVWLIRKENWLFFFFGRFIYCIPFDVLLFFFFSSFFY